MQSKQHLEQAYLHSCWCEYMLSWIKRSKGCLETMRDCWCVLWKVMSQNMLNIKKKKEKKRRNYSVLPWNRDDGEVLVCSPGHGASFGPSVVHLSPQRRTVGWDLSDRYDLLPVQRYEGVEFLDSLEEKKQPSALCAWTNRERIISKWRQHCYNKNVASN